MNNLIRNFPGVYGDSMFKSGNVPIRTAGIAFLFFLMALAQPVGAQSCTTPVDDLYINSDTTLCGGSYDISDEGDRGILIVNSSDIVLDCNGSTIRATGGFRLNINVTNVSNVTVKNCNIRGTTACGIYLKDASNILVLNNSLSGSGYTCGITLRGATDNLIVNNTILESGGQSVDMGNGCKNNTFIGNNISFGTLNGGAFLDEADLGHHTFKENYFQGNTYAIYLERSSANTIVNNTFVDNTQAGVLLHFGVANIGSSNNTIANNTFYNNSKGIAVAPSGGNPCTNNSIYMNNFTNNSVALALPTSFANNSIYRNYFAYSSTAVQLGSSTSNNTFYLNTFINNSQQASSSTTGNYFNDSIGQGNYWSDISLYGLDLVDSDYDGFYDSGSQYPYNKTNGGNVTENVTDWHPCVYEDCQPDTSSPLVTSISPPNNSFVRGIQYINATAVDARSGVGSVVANVSNATWSKIYNLSLGSANVWYNDSWDTGELIDGAYSIRINATDIAGNFNDTEYVTVTVDNTKPTISCQYPQNDTYAEEVWFNVTVDEPADWCGYSLDGRANVTTTNSSGNWNAVNSSMSEGSHSVIFHCNDTAGNMNSSATVYFTVDLTPPVIYTNLSNTSYTYKNFSIQFNATDNFNVEFLWYNNGTDNSTPQSSNFTFTINYTTDSRNNITFYANDSAGNLNETAIYFTVDTTKPTISSQYPQNDTYAEEVWFNVTVDEPADWCGYSLDGRANVTTTNSSGNWNAVNSSMSEGSHSVIFHCNDTAGNMNSSATVYFTVDTAAPIVAYASPTPPDNYNSSSATTTFNATVTDAATAISACLLELDNVNYTMDVVGTGTSVQCNLTNLTMAEGSHNYTIHANDSTNKWDSETARTLTIDTSPPTVTITSPTNVTYTSSSVALNYSASDVTTLVDWTGFSLDGEANQTGGNQTLSGLPNGNHNITVWANDTAGNMNSSTVYFSVDVKEANTPSDGGYASRPKIALLANSIDYSLSSDFTAFLKSHRIDVIHTTPESFSSYNTLKFIVILGGPDAYEGVGEIVTDLLTVDEIKELRTEGSRGMYVRTNVWKQGEVVMVIAGSDRGQTQQAEEENKLKVKKQVRGY